MPPEGGIETGRQIEQQPHYEEWDIVPADFKDDFRDGEYRFPPGVDLDQDMADAGQMALDTDSFAVPITQTSELNLGPEPDKAPIYEWPKKLRTFAFTTKTALNLVEQAQTNEEFPERLYLGLMRAYNNSQDLQDYLWDTQRFKLGHLAGLETIAVYPDGTTTPEEAFKAGGARYAAAQLNAQIQMNHEVERYLDQADIEAINTAPIEKCGNIIADIRGEVDHFVAREETLMSDEKFTAQLTESGKLGKMLDMAAHERVAVLEPLRKQFNQQQEVLKQETIVRAAKEAEQRAKQHEIRLAAQKVAKREQVKEKMASDELNELTTRKVILYMDEKGHDLLGVLERGTPSDARDALILVKATYASKEFKQCLKDWKDIDALRKGDVAEVEGEAFELAQATAVVEELSRESAAELEILIKKPRKAPDELSMLDIYMGTSLPEPIETEIIEEKPAQPADDYEDCLEFMLNGNTVTSDVEVADNPDLDQSTETFVPDFLTEDEVQDAHEKVVAPADNDLEELPETETKADALDNKIELVSASEVPAKPLTDRKAQVIQRIQETREIAEANKFATAVPLLAALAIGISMAGSGKSGTIAPVLPGSNKALIEKARQSISGEQRSNPEYLTSQNEKQLIGRAQGEMLNTADQIGTKFMTEPSLKDSEPSKASVKLIEQLALLGINVGARGKFSTDDLELLKNQMVPLVVYARHPKSSGEIIKNLELENRFQKKVASYVHQRLLKNTEGYTAYQKVQMSIIFAKAIDTATPNRSRRNKTYHALRLGANDIAENSGIPSVQTLYKQAVEARRPRIAPIAGRGMSVKGQRNFKTILVRAAAQYNIDPNFLAAFYYAENARSGDSTNNHDAASGRPTTGDAEVWREPARPYGRGARYGVSSAAAMGPFQFIPLTWDAYGVDGNKDGVINIRTLTDAAFGAAKYLSANGADNGEYRNAAWRYNNSQTYVNSVMNTFKFLRRNANNQTNYPVKRIQRAITEKEADAAKAQAKITQSPLPSQALSEHIEKTSEALKAKIEVANKLRETAEAKAKAEAAAAAKRTAAERAKTAVKGAKDLGMHKAVIDGKVIETRLYAIKGFKSSSEESTPGNAFYIKGADGHVVVGAHAVEATVAMYEAAKADGVQFSARSSFRTDNHQGEIYIDNGKNRAVAAPPGRSDHQDPRESAVDFNLPPGVFAWLKKNAYKYGFENYKPEAWHWAYKGPKKK